MRILKDNKYLLLGSFFLFCSFYIIPSCCYAQRAVSSKDLIENAKDLDGREVVYQGEVIGEVMPRGDYAWVNVNDGLNAIGIWLSRPAAGQIEYTGSFKAKGDWVEVVGKFNRACPLHGGDLDIHALKLVKIRQGRMVKDCLVVEKKRLIIILSGAMIWLLILELLKKKLRKK